MKFLPFISVGYKEQPGGMKEIFEVKILSKFYHIYISTVDRSKVASSVAFYIPTVTINILEGSLEGR